MKIVVPTRAGNVDSHFGHCEAYTIFTIDGNREIEDMEVLPSLQGCGCKSNIASVLQQKGVGVMLAGNMGDGALHVLKSHGIQVYRGCAGNIMSLVENYLQGGIKDSGIACHRHEDGHTCSHH